jgi:hypothetical protein
VNVTREGVGKGGGEADIGKGDSLADNVGSVKEDLVEDLQTRLELLDGSGVGLLVSVWSKTPRRYTYRLGVRDLVGEEVVGKDVLEEDLLVGESHPLVDGCTLLDVGGEDGLVRT